MRFVVRVHSAYTPPVDRTGDLARLLDVQPEDIRLVELSDFSAGSITHMNTQTLPDIVDGGIPQLIGGDVLLYEGQIRHTTLETLAEAMVDNRELGNELPMLIRFLPPRRYERFMGLEGDEPIWEDLSHKLEGIPVMYVGYSTEHRWVVVSPTEQVEAATVIAFALQNGATGTSEEGQTTYYVQLPPDVRPQTYTREQLEAALRGEHDLVIKAGEGQKLFSDRSYSLLPEVEVIHAGSEAIQERIQQRKCRWVTLVPDVAVPAGAIVHLRWVAGSSQEYRVHSVRPPS